ncbi:relaxase, partial [Campylobacter upsaliensis]|nr:relaxase [Campylobacter upsaliensis]EAI6220129.1 relaxase [Campylobacter upsaliensis]
DEEYLSEKKQRAFINSVKDVMSSHFLGHKYAFVMHNHQAKPHIHIVVNKYNVLENKKIHFAKKSDIKYFLRL